MIVSLKILYSSNVPLQQKIQHTAGAWLHCILEKDEYTQYKSTVSHW